MQKIQLLEKSNKFKAEYERACDEYNKARFEKEIGRLHKLGLEEEYSRAEKVKNMQFVESFFSNGFKKEEIVKLAKLSANEVDEILQGLTA